MKRRIVAILLLVTMIITFTCGVSAVNSDNEAADIKKEEVSIKSVGGISDYIAKPYLYIKYGNNSFYNNQWQTIKTLSKINNNIYMLDYQYDYDIDDILEQGVGSISELLSYCSKHLLKNKEKFVVDVEELGCSAFSCKNEKNELIMGRNFDYKDAPCFMVWTSPEDGYKSISMVDSNMLLFGDVIKPSINNRKQVLMAPYLPLDGINEKGFSVSILQVKADGTCQDNGKTDIINTVAIRAMLDKAANVKEAIELLEKFDMQDMLSSCSYHYMLNDAEGNSCIIEYIDNEMRVIDSTSLENKNKINLVTNFFISEDGVENTSEGEERYERIEEALKDNGGILSEVSAMRLLNSVHLNYKHDIYPWRVKTLWSAVYNSNQNSMIMCARLNYDDVYQFNVSEPLKAYKMPYDANISNYIKPKN